MRKAIFFFLAGFVLLVNPSFGQNDSLQYQLTLEGIIDLAITQSPSSKYIQNRDVNYYWRYRNFKTRFRPQLTLSGDLPNYTHSTQPITQPDGSI